MGCGIIAYVFLFVIPVGAIIAVLDPPSLRYVATMAGLAVLAALAILLLPRLLRRLRRRGLRQPSRAALASLNWPADLNRAELELHCAAWLRAHGWQVALTTHPDPDATSVYVMAARGPVTVGVLCDQRGEDLNPAVIRAFAKGSAALGATRSVLLTLVRGPLPQPCEVAARQAGVQLLRVTELPQINAFAPAAASEVETAA
jgi:hypothetical protein